MRRRTRAFTSLDFIIVVAIVLLVGLILPRFTRAKIRGGPRCLSNLKQVALAFRMWANDHGDAFPMQVPESNGGSLESVSKGTVLSTFLVMSNELISPKILACPRDTGRTRTNQFAGLTQKSISYFVGLDLSPTNRNGILIGDRNISVGRTLANGLISVADPATVSWTVSIHQVNGNVALTDGSAHPVTTFGLQQLLGNSGQTNRFVVP